MTSDIDDLADLEIAVTTAVGEAESLGEEGMAETLCTTANRLKANIKWMGGNGARTVYLARNQYDAWWTAIGNPDRERIRDFAKNNPTYGPYLVALRLAGIYLKQPRSTTNGAVSYFDSDRCKPPWVSALGFRQNSSLHQWKALLLRPPVDPEAPVTRCYSWPYGSQRSD